MVARHNRKNRENFKSLRKIIMRKKLKKIHHNAELHVKIAVPIILFIILPAIVILANEIVIKKSILHY